MDTHSSELDVTVDEATTPLLSLCSHLGMSTSTYIFYETVGDYSL